MPVNLAYVLGALLLILSVAVAFAVTTALAATIVGYVVLTTTCNLLKQIAVVDMVAVAAGFVLRAVAGRRRPACRSPTGSSS